ncbi:MAG: hypothetical protein Q8S84_03060 [bacterium]|nr:hypothetical protein [bacterium]MDP3380511.1 hypothetical protein [bacterium]
MFKSTFHIKLISESSTTITVSSDFFPFLFMSATLKSRFTLSLGLYVFLSFEIVT